MMLQFSLCLAAAWTTALQRALDGAATWTMERRLAGGTRTLVSSGTVDCMTKSGIVWHVLEPFPSSVAMTREAMVFTDEEGVRTKPLAELPHYADIRERTDAFAAGDAHAFDGLFKLEARERLDGGWEMLLTPEVSAIRRLFTEIELSGDALPTNVLLRLQDGGASVIRFKERRCDK